MKFIFEAKTEIPKCIISDDVLIIFKKTLSKLESGNFDKAKKEILEIQLLELTNKSLVKLINQVYKNMVVHSIPATYMKFQTKEIHFLVKHGYLNWNQLSFNSADLELLIRNKELAELTTLDESPDN